MILTYKGRLKSRLMGQAIPLLNLNEFRYVNK